MIKESDFRKKFLTTIGKKINQPILKSEWIKATALGGFREVGRSSLLIETNHSKIIIDCGVSPEPVDKGPGGGQSRREQGVPVPRQREHNDKRPRRGDTHARAHGPHGVRPIPVQVRVRGAGVLHAPTRDLAALLLFDYIKLVQRSGGTPIYDEKDIKKMLTHMITRDYGEVTNVTDEIKLTYHNAGHILGSSVVHLHIGEGMYNIVHSGDMKYGFTRLLDQADTRYPRDRRALHREHLRRLQGRDDEQAGRRAAAHGHDKEHDRDGGKVLIPVFSVGRSQEIMLVLETYLTNNPRYKLDVPVYLDGMILEASAIHTAYPEYLKSSLQHRILSNNSPFESEIFEVAKGEREEILEKGPSIILASSGMLNGGTALEYFKGMAEDPKNSLIFVGYNSINSLGRKIQNGFKQIALQGEDGKMEPAEHQHAGQDGRRASPGTATAGS